ncbi:hypothetical protein NDU88_003685 [Pleurodeles waltl]|uniref:Uncharacterized protein n=1 Tax=Pleurodeles waltl TaxID=8319 RepID=A0AAV7SGL9_PLEWA|nr:hypothetical protein NDU88_003685 [Pleurodeles waltl]
MCSLKKSILKHIRAVQNPALTYAMTKHLLTHPGEDRLRPRGKRVEREENRYGPRGKRVERCSPCSARFLSQLPAFLRLPLLFFVPHPRTWSGHASPEAWRLFHGLPGVSGLHNGAPPAPTPMLFRSSGERFPCLRCRRPPEPGSIAANERGSYTPRSCDDPADPGKGKEDGGRNAIRPAGLRSGRWPHR